MTLRLNSTLSPQDVTLVPPGSVLSNSSQNLVVLDNGYAADGRYNYPLYSLAGWRITSLGDQPFERMNVDTFKQKARSVCYGAAVDNGVAIAPVISALRRISADEENPPLGIGMHFHYGDNTLRERLRTARGLVLGHGDPNFWKGYAEFTYPGGANDPRHRIGGVTAWSRTMKVLHMDNPDTDIYLRPPTEADDREIARLRGVIWEVGARAKSEQRWCAAYETAVSVLGVSESSVTEVTATAPEVADLRLKEPDNLPTIGGGMDATDEFPVGAVFEYVGEGRDLTRAPDYSDANRSWGWTRVAPERQRAGMRYNTRDFIGPNGGSWGGDRRVLWDGRGEMSIAFYRDLMPHLPIGTVLGNGGNRYVRRSVTDLAGTNDWVGQEFGGMASSADFFGGTSTTTGWRITALPDTWRHGANNDYPHGREF